MRVPQDLLVLVGAVLAGGPVGVGTVITAFFNGPLIGFFSDQINKPAVARLTAHRTVHPTDTTPGTPGDPTQLVGQRRS